METIGDFERMRELMRKEDLALFYLSRPGCGVCAALKPKILSLLDSEFPEIPFYDVNLDEVPEAGGQLSIFTIPAVLVFSGGREWIREARYMAIDELTEKIRRLASLRRGQTAGE